MSDFSTSTNIYIGGLKSGVGSGKLKRHFITLFRQIGITVRKSQIIIVDRNPEYVYAFINLEDKEAVHLALHHLQTPERRDSVTFNFSLISDQVRQLKFDYRKSNKKKDEGYIVSNEPSVAFEDSLSSLIKPALFKRTYKFREKLGNETRNAEFKEGKFMEMNKRQIILNTVGKYVCSFLNSEGGTLYIGVNNDGRVVGISCSQSEEDRYRLQIDDAIKRVHPPLFPSNYKVDFIPVTDADGTFIHLKVVEITVDKATGNSQLYDFNDEVYVRRDASIQCLKARELQEWTRKQVEKEHQQQLEVHEQLQHFSAQMQMLSSEVGKQKTVIPEEDEASEEDRRYKSLQTKLQQIEEKNSELAEELEKLRRRKEKKKSKLCSIM